VLFKLADPGYNLVKTGDGASAFMWLMPMRV